MGIVVLPRGLPFSRKIFRDFASVFSRSPAFTWSPSVIIDFSDPTGVG